MSEKAKRNLTTVAGVFLILGSVVHAYFALREPKNKLKAKLTIWEIISIDKKLGIQVIRDKSTNCQYILTEGGIMPRLNQSGKVLCRKKDKGS